MVRPELIGIKRKIDMRPGLQFGKDINDRVGTQIYIYMPVQN